MATDTTKIMVGAATVSVGAWVTAGGAGSLTDIGHTKEPVVLGTSFSDYDVRSERAFGILKKVPQDMEITLRVPMLETIVENMRTAFRQPAANKSGTGDDLTLLIGDAAEQYNQIELVGPGPGTTGVRTLTFWRCIPTELAEVPYAKGDSQVFNATFAVLYDDSVATADKFFKSVDA